MHICIVLIFLLHSFIFASPKILRGIAFNPVPPTKQEHRTRSEARDLSARALLCLAHLGRWTAKLSSAPFLFPRAEFVTINSLKMSSEFNKDPFYYLEVIKSILIALAVFGMLVLAAIALFGEK